MPFRAKLDIQTRRRADWQAAIFDDLANKHINKSGIDGVTDWWQV